MTRDIIDIVVGVKLNIREYLIYLDLLLDYLLTVSNNVVTSALDSKPVRFISQIKYFDVQVKVKCIETRRKIKKKSTLNFSMPQQPTKTKQA